MVEIEQSAETLPPLNVGDQAHRRWRSLQELVVESLVVSLAMVVVDVLAHEETHVPFAEGDDATETLLFRRADEPLGIRVEIGTLRRETDRLDTPALEDLAKDPRGERVAVVNQIAGASQAAIDRSVKLRAICSIHVPYGCGGIPAMVTGRDCSAVTKKTRYRWSPASVSTSTVNRSQAVRPSQCACRNVFQGMRRLRSGAGSIPWSCRIRCTVVRAISWPRFESAPRIRVYPHWGILDRHPDHERGHVTSRHRPASTAAGAAVVCLGDQSPVPAENRVRRDDAGDLHQDAPSEFLAANGESTALGIGQAKRPRAQVLPEDPILLPEIRDQIVLVAVHPASERENEEL